MDPGSYPAIASYDKRREDRSILLASVLVPRTTARRRKAIVKANVKEETMLLLEFKWIDPKIMRTLIK
jgi:hypothetical protein